MLELFPGGSRAPAAVRLAAPLAALWILLAGPSARAQEEQEPPVEGVVVAVAGTDAAGALAAAEQAGGARWRGATLVPRDRSHAGAPEALLDRLREAYLGADFLRCLATVQEPAVGVDRLIEEGLREAAATAGVFGAACALGADDPDLAEELLERIFVAELDVAGPLEVTTPDFQALAERIRAEVLSRERVRVTVRTRPPGARVVADGGAHACDGTPCSLTLLPGHHVLSAEHLGWARRTLRARLDAGGELPLSLDPAAASVVRRQLAEALGADASPGEVGVARAAAAAFEARVVVMAWRREDRRHAAIYDRSRDRILARVAVAGQGGAATAVSGVVEEWRGITEPAPLYEEPWFWVGTVGAAVAAGVAVFLLVGLEETRHDIVFGL